MLGQLYDKALDGESCWVRHDDGQLRHLPVRSWLGGRHADSQFDTAVVNLCVGPTIDLGCGLADWWQTWCGAGYLPGRRPVGDGGRTGATNRRASLAS